ncbi:unnamed protein product [Acanthoscelides obtectus]|uniref:Uncharacterized protein n=1 Tax=Acanthoscelides obtectus TaxID=200917 RepID=A0A9P0KT15_ACAOB|nr:unnamed protein product [Acanthoscelides obtectus]CAK1631363.1 hypothetical protein AOBTE_LOCUS6908 [Acanthoscelides obtectus]
MELALLGTVNIRAQLDSAYWRNIHQHNDTITKNRYVLSKVIDGYIYIYIYICILEVCHEEIIKQINRASYLVIIGDEKTDISRKTQLVTIFRYVFNGEPIERFWN